MFIRILADNSIVYPYYLSSLPADFPHTSMSSDIATDFTSLEGHGIYVVHTTTQPTINPASERVEEGIPSHNGEIWLQTWNVVELTEQEQAEKQAAFVDFISKLIVNKTQQRLDSFAKTRNYDGILSACTYAASEVPKFNAEGVYCVQIRDATWATLYTLMGEVAAQTRPMPTCFEDIEGDLPPLTWPV